MDRPRPPRATPGAPERPTRRLIAATVMFAGLIVPAALAGAVLLRFYGIGIAPLAMAAWLTCNLVALWQGRSWAWTPAVTLFVFGFLISGTVLVFVSLDRNLEMIRWAAAATAHFAVGLLALFSLKRWFDQMYWLPAKDALSMADRPALLAVLRARKK